METQGRGQKGAMETQGRGQGSIETQRAFQLSRIPFDFHNFPSASAMRIRCGFTYCVIWLGRCQRLQSIAEGHAEGSCQAK